MISADNQVELTESNPVEEKNLQHDRRKTGESAKSTGYKDNQIGFTQGGWSI